MMTHLIILVQELIIFHTFNYTLRYVTTHLPLVYNHPSPVEHSWMLVDGHCRPVRNRSSTLSNNVKEPVVDIDGFSSSSDGESDESECFSSDDMVLE